MKILLTLVLFLATNAAAFDVVGSLPQGLGDGRYVQKAGDTMSGPLTVTSSVTVTGNAFSVGGSSFAINNSMVVMGSNTVPMVNLMSIYGGNTNASSPNFETAGIGILGLGNTAPGRLYSALNSFLITDNLDYNGSDMVSNRDDVSLVSSMLEMGQEGISLYSIPPGANPVGSVFSGMPIFRLGISSNSYIVNTKFSIGRIATPDALLDLYLPYSASNITFKTDDNFGEGMYLSQGNTMSFNYGDNAASTFHINYAGYNNGSTQFRSLYFDNGKTGNVAFLDGVNSRIGIGTSSPDTKLHISSSTITMDGTGSPTAGGALCLNTSGQMAKCTSAVDASGNCTCP